MVADITQDAGLTLRLWPETRGIGHLVHGLNKSPAVVFDHRWALHEEEAGHDVQEDSAHPGGHGMCAG